MCGLWLLILYFLLGGNHKGTFLYTAFLVLRCSGSALEWRLVGFFVLIWLLCLAFSAGSKREGKYRAYTLEGLGGGLGKGGVQRSLL